MDGGMLCLTNNAGDSVGLLADSVDLSEVFSWLHELISRCTSAECGLAVSSRAKTTVNAGRPGINKIIRLDLQHQCHDNVRIEVYKSAGHDRQILGFWLENRQN